MEWPLTTEFSCWNCVHPFDTVPVPLPVRYDPKTRIFYVIGIFCSWGCAKRYNMERESISKNQSVTLLSLLRHRVVGLPSGCDGGERNGITAAPFRSSLKCFGGPMTIEEFRSGLQPLLRVARPVPLASGNLTRADAADRGLWDASDLRSVRCVQPCEYAQPSFAAASQEPAVVAPVREDLGLADSIVNAPSVRNQPYKLRRSKPVGNIGNTLFESMNVKVERVERARN